MRKGHLFIYILIFHSSFSFSQKNSNDDYTDSIKLEKKVNDFIVKTATIKIVSLEPKCYEEKRHLLPTDSVAGNFTICYAESIITSNKINNEWIFTVKEERIKKSVFVSEVDKVSLLAIIYNAEETNSMTVCYEPRHGIFFYDDEDRRIGFIEICFECSRLAYTSNTPDPGMIDRQAFNRLKQIFSKYLLIDKKRE